jgi:hypothetical protein
MQLIKRSIEALDVKTMGLGSFGYNSNQVLTLALNELKGKDDLGQDLKFKEQTIININGTELVRLKKFLNSITI